MQRIAVVAPGRVRERLDAALAASDSMVVLVPWETDIGCGPLPWTSSARWAAPGRNGLFRGRLRKPEAWLRGVPTIDVTSPSTQPYTGEPSEDLGLGPADGSRPRLTPAELFSLMQALPRDSDLERRPEDATEPLRRWVATHPAVARREPADHIISSVRWEVTYHRVRLAALPVAGTYRFTVDVAGDSSFTFFARTMAGPESAWGSDGQSLPESPLGRTDSTPPTAAVYHADAFVARTERSLPNRRIDAERRFHGYSFRVGAFPVDSSNGTREWAGSVLFAVAASTTLATGSRGRARFAAIEEQTRNADAGMRMPARFIVNPGGAVRIVQQHQLPDGRLLTIRATRVSRSVILP